MARQKKEEAPKKRSQEEMDLDAIRSGLKECIDEEESERAKMLDDLKFCTLDQWPEDIRRERENDPDGPRPCLTIDKINQYIVQVVNDMRQGKPGINVRPQDDAADIETAKILKGIIRNIEDQSNADIAYAIAGESAAKIGLGYFRITTEYVSDKSDEQDIFIRAIPNTFSVYLNKHLMPDGSDATRGYIVESMPVEKFKELFPGAKVDKKEFEDLDPSIAGVWRTENTITVVEEYCIKLVARTVVTLENGETIRKDEYEAMDGEKPAISSERTTQSKKLYWKKATAVELLDSRELPGQYIPIVEVVGRESWVEGRRILWGLVRPAKDSLRMYNYWASTITERMGLAPKIPFVGAKGQFDGVENQWKEANRKNRAYIEYNPIEINGNALPRPDRVGPTPMEAALLNQMQVIEHDVQTSLGMFKAAVGETESQQSGRAILALQRESDTGTYHFGANQGISIRHAGRIIVDLIPHYYDTKRVVRIIGEDGEVKTAQIDPEQDVPRKDYRNRDGAIQSIYNPGIGKYDVSITVGPSYNTKRMEAAATFVEMAKGSADPASAAVLRYLVMRNSDSAGADEAARLLKTLLPPQALQALDSKDPIPPEAQLKLAQAAQQLQAMNQKVQELGAENQQLRSGAQVKQAQLQVDARTEFARINLQEKVEQEEARLAREKAEREIALKEWVAREELRIKRIESDREHMLDMDDQQFQQILEARELRMRERQAMEQSTQQQPS